MYLDSQVWSKLDGLGEVVRHYGQRGGWCTGVSLEWLRRVMIKGKEDLATTTNTLFGGRGYPIGPAEAAKYKRMLADGGDNLEKKETRWEETQKGVYAASRQAFLATNPTVKTTIDRLGEWLEEVGETQRVKKQYYTVSAPLLKYAKEHNYASANAPNLSSHDLDRLKKHLNEQYDKTYDDGHEKWRKECPIELGVFKACSEDLENATFDDKAVELRARFSGLNVVVGANASKVNTTKAYEATTQALRDPELTVRRGLIFGVLEKGGSGGHSHAVYYSQNNPKKYLWLDPNYGVWRMTMAHVLRAMIYLYDHTDVQGEKGVYQVNGLLVPTGFEYTIWEVSG
jgi:hypothetical protein